MHTPTTESTREAVLAWVAALYTDAVDHKDAAGFAAAFTEDARMRFGNAEPVVGRGAIEAAIAYFFSAITALRHETVGAWYDDGALIVEAIVTYTRHDGGIVSVPAVTIFRLTDAAGPPFLAHRCQMYVDLAPLFAPGPAENADAAV